MEAYTSTLALYIYPSIHHLFEANPRVPGIPGIYVHLENRI